jgi:hypothetical protein
MSGLFYSFGALTSNEWCEAQTVCALNKITLLNSALIDEGFTSKTALANGVFLLPSILKNCLEHTFKS